MSELTTTQSERTATPRRWGAGLLLWALVPLLLLGVLLALLVVTGAGLGTRTAPPIEELTIDRITLPARDTIVVEVVYYIGGTLLVIAGLTGLSHSVMSGSESRLQHPIHNHTDPHQKR